MTDEELVSLFRRSQIVEKSRSTDNSDSDAPGTDVFLSCPGHRKHPSLWPIESGCAATVSSLGTQTRKLTDSGLRTVPELEDVLSRHEPRNVAVVGHTDCSVIKDAYDDYLSDTETSGGVAHRTAPIFSLIQEATDSGLVGAGVPKNLAVYRLIEYNVTRQTAYLFEELGSDVTVAGYVHDRNGAYDDGDRRYQLVALNHETEPDSILSSVPGDEEINVSTLV